MFFRTSRTFLFLCTVLALGTACTDSSPLTPSRASATQMESVDQQLMLRILEKLDSIEDRVERESSLIFARLDAMMGNEGAMLMAGGPDNRGGAGGGLAQEVAALHLLADSIMELSSFLALDAAQVVDVGVCGALKLEGGGELKSKTMGDAEGQAGVGVKPWDTGAMAQVELTQRFALEFGAAAKVEVGGNACIDLRNIGSNPPVRTSSSAAMTRMAGADFETTLLALQSQLGIDEASVNAALTANAGVLQSGNFGSLSNLATTLPLPTQFTSPLSVVRSQLANARPVDLLCDAPLGNGRILNMAAEGCSYIQANDLPGLGTFLDLGRDFTSLRNSFDGVCARVNTIVSREVSIGLSSWGDGTLNLRLFPSGWAVSCST